MSKISSILINIFKNKFINLFFFMFIVINASIASVDSIPYPLTANKLRLGFQTSGDGLLYRGLASDTITKPTNYVDKTLKSYVLLDTNTNIIWQYKKAVNNAWTRVGGSISSGLTGVLPVENGGTGSTTQNFVDLTTTQSIGGAKTFTSAVTATRFNPTANTATGTGMYLPSANTLGFSTNGTNKLTILSNGNVGINTTSPAEKLDVNGTIINNAGGVQFPRQFRNDFTPTFERADLMFLANFTSDNGFRLGTIASSGGTTFQSTKASDSGVKTNISLNPDGGNVGIGTASPTARLHVKGSTTDANESALKIDNSGNANLLTVINNGNVGINTNNPLANLVLFNPTGTSTRFVAGNTNTPTALYSTYLSQGWSIFELYKDGLGSTGTTAFVGGINDASPTSTSATMTFVGYNKAVGTPGINDLRTHIIVGGLEAVNSGNFQFLTMNSGTISEKLRISASGNVGIGTTSPVVQFHTTGGVRFAGLASITDLRTDALGNLFNGSDFNLKNSIDTINFGLSDVLKLKPVSFNWNDEQRNINEYKSMGFIAQDVMNIIPNAASTMGDGYMQVDYNAIVATLTKAIQEQTIIIKQLEDRIKKLEEK